MTVRKRVLITGASSGVGVAAAEQFALAGYDVALLARSEDGLNRGAETVREAGGEALVLPCDVTDRDAIAAAMEQVQETFGGLDVVVVNAAMTIYGPFEDVEAEDFDRVFAVTFMGAVNTIRAALPALKASRGVIVSVGSLNSRVPLPAWSSYAAAKHAERGFLNSLAIELRQQHTGVRVTQLHPGPINTPVWTETPSAVGHLPRRPPDGYPPEQVAAALVRLAAKPRPEVLFGAEAIGVDQLWATARPVGDFVLGMVYHWFQSGKRPAQSDVDALRSAVGKGFARDGLAQRPSITSAVRGVAGLGAGALQAPAFVKALRTDMAGRKS